MASLDGWSLDQKIERVKEEVNNDIRELKMNFALLYDYIKKIEQDVPEVSKAKKKKEKN